MSTQANPIKTTNNNITEWRANGELHREDGPAVEYPDGSRMWFINDNLHREDGPAIERPGGYREWWSHNKQYTFDNWCFGLGISDEDKAVLILRYGGCM